MAKMTLREYWNDHCDNVTSLFLAGNGCPAGQTYTQNLEEEGEDYCDMHDLLETGLCNVDEYDRSRIWDCAGKMSEDGSEWRWDGLGGLTDFQGNDYHQFVVFSECSQRCAST